jgi:hypothetical protein
MSQPTAVQAPDEKSMYSGQRTSTIVHSRSHVRVSPKYGGSFHEGDILRIELPSVGSLDPSTFAISMALTIESGDGANLIPPYEHKKHYDFLQNGAVDATDQPETTKWCSLKNAGIASCFHRIRILSGSTVLEDLLDYPTLQRLATEMTSSSDHRDHSHLLLEGVGDGKNEDHKRIRRSNNNGKIFVTRLLSGILQSGKYLPLHLMGR